MRVILYLFYVHWYAWELTHCLLLLCVFLIDTADGVSQELFSAGLVNGHDVVVGNVTHRKITNETSSIYTIIGLLSLYDIVRFSCC